MGRLTHTVSGSIATVRSPAVAPIESLKVHFSPIQEGTGDPSPSNVRPITGWTGVTGYKSGKNLINYNALTVFDIGDDYGERRGFIFTKPGTYYVKALKTWENNSYIYCRVKNADGTYGNIQYFIAVKTVTNRTITIGSGQTLLIFNSVKTTEPSGTIEATIERFNGWGVVVSFNDVDSYEPYSGETIPVTFHNFSTNLFDSTNATFSRITKLNGIYSNNDTDDRTNAQLQIQLYNDMTVLSTLEPHNFTETGIISFNFNIDNSLCNRICFKHNGITKDFRIYVPFIYGMGTYTISCSIVSNDPTTVGGLQLSDISIKRGNENVIDYANNKVYGGYVNLVTGEIFAEYGSYVLTGSVSDGFVYRGTVTHGDNVHYQFGTKLFDRIVENTSSTKTYCNIAKATISQSGWALDFMFYAGTPQYQVNFFIKDSVCDSTEESFNAWLSEHNVHFVYKLATPQLIATLTPQELATFKGYSNFWSNAGDVDVTYQVVESSEMTKERRKIFAGNAPTIHTASGSVANFEMEPGLNRNLKSCKVGFLPVQEGSGDPFPPINQNGSIVGVNNIHNESELSSFKIHFSPIQLGTGDPSPTNIRPITGWTGVTGYKGGKNLLNLVESEMVNVGYSREFPNPLKNYGPYTITCNGVFGGTGDKGCAISFVNEHSTSAETIDTSPVPFSFGNTTFSHTFTLTQNQLNAKYIRFFFRSGGSTYSDLANAQIQIEFGSTATSYESYSAPTSYPVSWESQGTVYGGYVDLVSGDVVAEYEILSDTWGNFTKVSGETGDGVTEGRYKRFAHAVYGNGITNHYTDCCNVAKYNYANINGNIHYYIVGTSYNCRVYLPIGTDENLQIQAIGKLVTPIKITTLTSTQIALATGKSSYWSNADAVTVETLGNVRPIKGWGKLNIYSSKQNIFDPNDLTTININGSDRNAVAYTSPGTYKLKAYGSSTEAYLSGIVKNYDGAWSSVYYVVGNRYAQNMSITIANGQTLYVYDMQNSPKETSVSRFVSWQFQVSLGDSFLDSYESYSGSKYSIEFPVQGKNLFDEKYPNMPENTSNVYYRYYHVGDGAVIASSDIPLSTSLYGNLFVLPGKTSTGVSTDINDVLIGKSRKITPIDGYITVAYRNHSNVDPRKYHVMIERAAEGQTTPSAYEPMNGLCGGYVDLVTGEAMATYAKFTYDGSEDESWYVAANYSSSGLTRVNINTIVGKSSGNILFNYGKKTSDQSSWNGWMSSANHNMLMYIPNEIDSKAAWLAYLSKNPLEIVCELETPILVTTLTPTQIQALKGTNNILSDANGIIEVKYWSH